MPKGYSRSITLITPGNISTPPPQKKQKPKKATGKDLKKETQKKQCILNTKINEN